MALPDQKHSRLLDFIRMDSLSEQEFCKWLAEMIADEDDDRYLIDEASRKLVELGYLSPKDVALRHMPWNN